jgi:hypothetical protein
MTTDVESILALSIPIIAIIMGIGLAMLSSWFDFRKKREIFELHHKERMAAIEKGMDVPELPQELLQGNRNGNGAPGCYLRAGFIWLLVGLAVMVALHAEDKRGAYFGLIPAAVGLANLLYYVFRPRLAKSTDNSNTAPTYKA